MDAIQAEKDTAMRRYRRLQQIGTLLRCLEVAAAVLFLSWSSARLSAGFVLRVAAVLLSPHFVFLLGNAIVLLLLAKSGQVSSSSSTAAVSGGGDIYEEFLAYSLAQPPPLQEEEEEEQQVVYEDKEVCVETRAFRRSWSDRMERRRSAPPQPKLHRSVTDLSRRKFRRAEAEDHEEEEEEEEKKEVVAEAEDAEEFRQAVEAFITRQTKFHREECMAATFRPPLICSSPQRISLQ